MCSITTACAPHRHSGTPGGGAARARVSGPESARHSICRPPPAPPPRRPAIPACVRVDARPKPRTCDRFRGYQYRSATHSAVPRTCERAAQHRLRVTGGVWRRPAGGGGRLPVSDPEPLTRSSEDSAVFMSRGSSTASPPSAPRPGHRGGTVRDGTSNRARHKTKLREPPPRREAAGDPGAVSVAHSAASASGGPGARSPAPRVAGAGRSHSARRRFAGRARAGRRRGSVASGLRLFGRPITNLLAGDI